MPPFNESEHSDSNEMMARLIAWMREHGIGQKELLKSGMTREELRRLFDQGSDGNDANATLLHRLMSGLQIPPTYVSEGSVPEDVSKIKRQRLEIWEFIEEFCQRMDLRGKAAKNFALFAMQWCERRLNASNLAMYERGIPETVDDITPIYAKWLRNNRK